MPTKQQYALKIVAKSSLVKARAKQKVFLQLSPMQLENLIPRTIEVANRD